MASDLCSNPNFLCIRVSWIFFSNCSFWIVKAGSSMKVVMSNQQLITKWNIPFHLRKFKNLQETMLKVLCCSVNSFLVSLLSLCSTKHQKASMPATYRGKKKNQKLMIFLTFLLKWYQSESTQDCQKRLGTVFTITTSSWVLSCGEL